LFGYNNFIPMKRKSASIGCNKYYDIQEDNGRENLTNSFLEQELLSTIPNKQLIAEKFAASSEIKGYKNEEEIYHQGDFGMYLFFVLTGSCKLFINDNFVTEIGRGQSFGEFPLLNPGVKYSVSVYSNEDHTCIAKVSNSKLGVMGHEHPEIWKNMAKMLANRLKIRSEAMYSKKPHAKPRIFIGSSSNGLGVAGLIQTALDYYKPDIWNHPKFKVGGKSILEILDKAVNEYDYGIFVFTPDDDIVSKEETKKITRDNVIFELGMFAGKLSRTKAFVVHPRDEELKIMSDYGGIITAKYEKKDINNLTAADLKPACSQIRGSIKSQERARRKPKPPKP
jgi:CRP/FNR family transcriptional regulator, cyclic AMP receptor protein